MQRPTLLLDEPVLGIDVYLRDLGWDVVNVRDILGFAKEDEKVIALAKEKSYVIVTADRKLVRRCKLQDVKVIEVGMKISP